MKLLAVSLDDWIRAEPEAAAYFTNVVPVIDGSAGEPLRGWVEAVLERAGPALDVIEDDEVDGIPGAPAGLQCLVYWGQTREMAVVALRPQVHDLVVRRFGSIRIPIVYVGLEKDEDRSREATRRLRSVPTSSGDDVAVENEATIYSAVWIALDNRDGPIQGARTGMVPSQRPGPDDTRGE